MTPIRKIIDCPKCNEGDERHVGLNICEICECRFFVKDNRAILHPISQPFAVASAYRKD